MRGGVYLNQPNGGSDWLALERPDAARRTREVTSPIGNFDYTFSGASHVPRGITTPSGAYITNTFDSAMRLTGTYLKDNLNNTLNSHTYGYNVASLRTNMTLTAGNVWNYT